jgi:FtsH-binding integral membrane protein
MKQATSISAALGAIASALASLSCCLPLGFAAALGAGAASAFLTTLRPWLLGLSVVLLGVGFWQRRRARQCSVRGRWFGELLLWLAVAVVLGMMLFPQQIAGFLADGFRGTGQ